MGIGPRLPEHHPKWLSKSHIYHHPPQSAPTRARWRSAQRREMLESMESAVAADLTQICGADNVITDPQQLRTYECDGLTAHRCSPGLVVLPESAEQVAAIVRVCAARHIPFVARGSGTGLSG